jgi:hypothetical protein
VDRQRMSERGAWTMEDLIWLWKMVHTVTFFFMSHALAYMACNS